MKLVATDLDGTIVHHGNQISARTVEAILACQDAGVKVVFCTGRPHRWMGSVVEATGNGGTAICANGAMVVDLASGDRLLSHSLGREQVFTAATAMRAAVPDVTFAVEALSGFRLMSSYPMFDGWEEPDHVVGASLEALLDDDPEVVKLLALSHLATPDELWSIAQAELGVVVTATHSAPAGSGIGPAILEMSAPGVTKGSTLAELAGRWGIAAEDVVAFGDMPNDIEMLRWAGRSYAMADGHPLAHAAASGIAPSIADDGVAQILEALLKK